MERSSLDEWRHVSASGDKESLPIAPPAYWPEIAADSDDCVRSKCPHASGCFYSAQKERAIGADVLIVNHALLLANRASGGTVFPLGGRHLVIEEAHRIEEFVCEAYGARVTKRRVSYAVSAIRRKAADLDDYLAAVLKASEGLFEELKDFRVLGDEEEAPPSYHRLVMALVAVRNLVESNLAEEVNKLATMVGNIHHSSGLTLTPS